MSVVWERPDPARRRSPALDRTAIVDAACALADEQGLAAATLRGVAARLGVRPMRFYTHLDSHTDLLDLMADRICGEITLAPPGDDWRADLRAVATATAAVARRHPWYVTLLGSRPPYGPHGLAYQERVLAALDRPDLPPDTLMYAANAFLGYLVGLLQLEVLRAPADAGAHLPDAAQLSYLARTVADGRHPTLARLFAHGRQLGADKVLLGGLEIVLDGIDAHLTRRR